MNRRAYDALTGRQRDVLRRAGREAVRPLAERLRHETETWLTAACSRDDFTLVRASAAQRAVLRHTVAPVYDQLARDPLTRELVAASEVILVTRETNRKEIDILRSHCTACQHLSESVWDALPKLRLDQAAALPITAETGGGFQVFTIGERLTPHVRHRQKYVDVPVPDSRAFVFRGDGRSATTRAGTLREFVAVLDRIDVGEADGYLRRGDFSRWISDVFGDHALARELQHEERRYVDTRSDDALDRVAAAIRSRYELTEEDPVFV